MIIGSIVKSNSHISYLCRVYGKMEAPEVPSPADYAFGTFVAIRPTEEHRVQLVGVVRDTVLLNPEYGTLGPRLSGEEELMVLSPDYVNEKGVLVDILILGWLDGEHAYHTVPALAAQVGSRVELVSESFVQHFHRDAKGRFLIGYLPPLLMRNDPMIASLLLSILQRLSPAFPDQAGVISVLQNNLAWKARVVPAG